MSTYDDGALIGSREDTPGSLLRSPAPRRPRRRSGVDLGLRLPGLVRIVDALLIVATGIATDLAMESGGRLMPERVLGVLLIATLTLNCLEVARAYSIRSLGRTSVQLVKVAIAWSITFACIAAFTYSTSRSAGVLGQSTPAWFLANGVLLAAVRLAVGVLIGRWQNEGRLGRNIAVVGRGPAAAAFADQLRKSKGEANVVGVFWDGNSARTTPHLAGDLATLVPMTNRGDVDEIILVMPEASGKKMNNVIRRFCDSPVEVSVHLGFSGLDYPPQDLVMTAGLARLIVQRRPLSGWGAPLKRAEDIVLAALILVIVVPVLAVIALAIKLDSRGPILFRQERYGFNNNPILVCKFRSMFHQLQPDPGVPQATRNDRRVTRVGSLLRRTSLDELPQLFNVLGGTMSLVGPRPHATAHNQKYAALIDGYLSRHRMKPGITGWAQVNGWRGETVTTEQMRRRLEHDLFYIANWSILLDIKILMQTLPVVLRGTNAY